MTNQSSQQPSPIPCQDSDGNQYTVFATEDIVAGNAPSDELKNPIWYVSLDGRVARVVMNPDRETGKYWFVCPELEDLELFPVLPDTP